MATIALGREPDDNTPMARALAGLRVLDFTTLWPGPLATCLLADLGAEVVRVEAGDRPDLLRYMAPHDRDGEGAAWRMVNRNKRSLQLDLKAPGAAEAVQRLVQRYDVVVEQFRPGVLDRLGVGYEALQQVNPRLVWCAITAWGQTGPWRDRPGHDIDFLAIAGVAHTNRHAESAPSSCAALFGDVAGGTWPAVAGILAAVVQRQATGVGQFVDVAMGDGALWLNAMAASAALAGGHDTDPGNGVLTGGGPYGHYRTRDGRWLAVGALEPKFFEMFCTAMRHPEWLAVDLFDPSAATELRREIAATIAERDLVDWQGVFAEVPCCVEPVLTPREAVHHAQFAARGMVVDVPSNDGDVHRQVGTPIQLSASPPRRDHVANAPGHDSAAVLADAGFSASEIEKLRATGAVS
jgi:crotonobetainyl-CoA:carnitine CoA-transferase CaiB-like acyl-CoA transferase